MAGLEHRPAASQFETPTLKQFRQQVEVSQQQICHDIWSAGSVRSRVKNQNTAVANLDTIIRATLKLSNQKGFAATSLRDLSAESGLSMGGLYAYIGSKDELAELIQHHGRSLIMSVLEQQVEGAESATDRLQMALRAHLFLSEIMQPWFFFCFMEARYLGKKPKATAIAAELQTEQFFVEILNSGVASGEFSVENAPMSASMLKALLQDWYLKRGKYRRREITVEDYAAYLWKLVKQHVEHK